MSAFEDLIVCTLHAACSEFAESSQDGNAMIDNARRHKRRSRGRPRKGTRLEMALLDAAKNSPSIGTALGPPRPRVEEEFALPKEEFALKFSPIS